MKRKKRLRDNKLLLNLYQIYKYIIFFPFLGLSTVVLACFALPTVFIFKADRIGRKFGRIWSRFNAYMTPMFVSVLGMENIDPNRSYIVVANHLSLYDILAVYGWLPMDFRYVMKMELRRVPIMGYSAEKIGHICIDRSNTERAITTINAARDKISDGTSIFFFPEGKRSSTNAMLPFKKGAFRLALDMQLPVVPITIIGTNDIVPTDTISLFPGKVKIIVHKPLDITAYTHDSMHQLMDDARKIIKSGYGK